MNFLETDRLILRNVKAKDAAIIYDYRNNEICGKYQRGQIKDCNEIAELVEKRKNDVFSMDNPFMIAVALKDTDEMVGEIVIMPKDGTISLGYTFSYRYHRKGYAYESLAALISMLHERYPEWDFICFVEQENVPNMNLLIKLGYTNIGYLSQMESQVFGKWTKSTTEKEITEAIQKQKCLLESKIRK